MSANDTQVGGLHYKSEYQHWDWVFDTDQHYLIACATKYVSRWRSKNGVEDLEKSCHYLAKAQELGVQQHSPLCWPKTNLFLKGRDPWDVMVLERIMQGRLTEARMVIRSKIAYLGNEEHRAAGPDAAYVDQ